MRPYNLKRWHHLDILCLGHEPISPVVAEDFTKLIPHASHLQSLEFEDAEETLRTHTDLAPSFAALQTIKHIIIVRGNQHTCSMLEAMRWPLESAMLHRTLFGLSWHDPDLLGRMHPATPLKNGRATLKYLNCHDWSGSAPSLPTYTYPVYPKLEALTVTNTRCSQAVQWAISYPALKSLSVQTVESISHHFHVDEALLADARMLNIHKLATHGQPWGELEYFHGSVLDLYLLGFTCRIRHLYSWLNTSVDTLHFSPIMATARPTLLTLLMSVGLLYPPTTYLHAPGLADVKNLELHVTMCVDGSDGNEGDFDIDAFLVGSLFLDRLTLLIPGV
ncbi:hypothetical protein GSI_15426 [Ganoderma sinense ZZ0214-1]|uniref:Uncharacterized protein n=1 Tax=Ganoderma sinense ZZ0214-1 TaxID=1077348 RepID=A0A2G8RMJ6_9APHY|nr:hypothetical protein GSI_15426 [Ganoderma sinense ZZ0214-1]